MQFQDQSQPWHTTGSQDFQFRQGKNLPGTMGPFTQKIFLQQVKKYFFLFFALIKKTFLQNLVEIIFRYPRTQMNAEPTGSGSTSLVNIDINIYHAHR